MTQERDTHFQGFADLLFPEVSKLFFTLYARIEEHRPIEVIDAVEDEIRTLLAQRGYDLVKHTVLHIDPYHLDALPYEEIPARIPDITAWPKQPTE